MSRNKEHRGAECGGAPNGAAAPSGRQVTNLKFKDLWSAHNYSFVVGQHKAAEQLANKMEKVRPHFIGPGQLLFYAG